MAIRTVGGNEADFEKCPEGMKLARCFKVIDLGTHIDPGFGKEIHKAKIYFELPKTLQKEGPYTGQPFIINKGYNLSHHKKSHLRGDLEAWYGRRFDTAALDKAGGFDLEKIIGRAALINIVHSEDGKYANIATISPLPEGMECPPAINTPFIFSLEDFSPVKFAQLSAKMQKYIAESGEYIEMHRPREERQRPVTDGGLSEMEDDIPF